MSHGIIPFYENYIKNFSNISLHNENYLMLLNDICFLFSNITAGTENQCDKVVLYSNIINFFLSLYKLLKGDIIYDILYILFCSIVNGSREAKMKILFEVNAFEYIRFCLNQDREVVLLSIKFISNSIDYVKNNSTNYEKIIEILTINNIIERLECLQHDKNSDVSSISLNILNLIWDYNDNLA